MTDLVERINLLEGPAWPREIAIQDADAAITDLDGDLPRRVGGPNIADVPADYLAHRAWGRSVDVYDPAWPEETRRNVIVVAPAVHKTKGTVDGVEKALSALNVDATVTEWWQTVPRGVPYTFSVRAFARARLYDGPLLDARLIKVIFASILRAKGLSRAFDLTVVAALPAPLRMAPVLIPRCRVALAAVPVLPPGVVF
ncbi:phage tail protein I [Methylobacterium radiotolerans]|uniref:phage tail protein I n=1 Tax=Methylobacterium radiotolerans TaxID=31998 RepID=UPI001F287806|nr:phage tail protein I [Methylobacterium radiotolerans]UIY44145.1 phage tail protein I [Methylobacterium radiotolerans]